MFFNVNLSFYSKQLNLLMKMQYIPYIFIHKSRIFGLFYKTKVGGRLTYESASLRKKLHHKYPHYKLYNK